MQNEKKLAIIGAICFVAFVVFGIIWINKGDKMVQLTEYGKQVAFLQAHEEEMTKEAFEVDGKFCYAEVEFPDEKTANEYVWPYPEILGPKGEMTNQPEERMSVYWLKSRVS